MNLQKRVVFAILVLLIQPLAMAMAMAMAMAIDLPEYDVLESLRECEVCRYSPYYRPK